MKLWNLCDTWRYSLSISCTFVNILLSVSVFGSGLKLMGMPWQAECLLSFHFVDRETTNTDLSNFQKSVSENLTQFRNQLQRIKLKTNKQK